MIKAKVENGTVETEVKGNVVRLTQDLLNIVAALYTDLSESQRRFFEQTLKSDDIWDEIKKQCGANK